MHIKKILAASTAISMLYAGGEEAKVTAQTGAKVFRLDGAGVTYAMGVDEKGYLQQLYWGASLDPGDPLVSTDPVKTGDPMMVKEPGEI